MKMNEATTKLVEELAAKLGTTAEHLWGVLVRQAPISGVCDALVIVAWIIGLAWALRLVRSKTEKPKTGYAEWGEEGALLAWLVWGITAAFVMIVAGACFADIVASLVNPEYWALKQVMP
jgi:hypothetical protein